MKVWQSINEWLTAAIGLQNSALKPIANKTPAVLRVITSFVVCNSSAISVLALRRDVLEKQAQSAVQLVAKTIMHLRHIGKLSYSAEAAVSCLLSRAGTVWSNMFLGWTTAASAAIGEPIGSACSDMGVGEDIEEAKCEPLNVAVNGMTDHPDH
jgi:hypothetical protein